MLLRRKFWMVLAGTIGTLGLAIIPVLADELLGVISKVDVEGKKITVIEKDTDKEIEVKITDDTEQVTKGGFAKVDLEKLDARVKKSADSGKKGVAAKITHEKGVASKLEFRKASIEDPKPPPKKKKKEKKVEDDD
jgi:hypothetical protein